MLRIPRDRKTLSDQKDIKPRTQHYPTSTNVLEDINDRDNEVDFTAKAFNLDNLTNIRNKNVHKSKMMHSLEVNNDQNTSLDQKGNQKRKLRGIGGYFTNEKDRSGERK